MENLGPEKIDIVDWSADPAKFVASALSPAVATGVQVISEKNKTAIAFIHDDQLSLAIGKEGQNARLAAKLTGWKIGIESTEAHAEEGRCRRQVIRDTAVTRRPTAHPTLPSMLDTAHRVWMRYAVMPRDRDMR